MVYNAMMLITAEKYVKNYEQQITHKEKSSKKHNQNQLIIKNPLGQKPNGFFY